MRGLVCGSSTAPVSASGKRCFLAMRRSRSRWRPAPRSSSSWAFRTSGSGLADEVDALLENDEALLLDEHEGLTSAQRKELQARIPELRALVEQLQAAAIPETIQHDDLHDGQIFVRDGQHVIADWGDSCVSQPFHTLTVTLRALAWRHGLEPGAEPLLRLRDAYLEPYGASAALAGLAYRTGTLARALAWHRHLQAREPEHWDREDAESVPYGLRLFLENGPIGTWK